MTDVSALAVPDVDDAFEVRLLTGVGRWMQAQGLGVWLDDLAAQPGGAAPVGVPVIRAAGMRDDQPLAYSLDTYVVADSASDLDDSTVGLQVMCRSGAGQDRRVTIAMADQLFDRLHAATNLHLRPDPATPARDVFVVQAYRRSGVNLGMDSNSRWERSQNYYLDVSRPTTNRLD